MYYLLLLNFLPLLTIFLLFLILVPGQKFYLCAWSCIIALITVFPTAFIQYFVLNLPIFQGSSLLAVLVTAIIFNGLIEETLKMAFMFLIPQKKHSLAVFFTLTLLCGFALGTFESVIYLLNALQSGQNIFADEMYKLIVIRSATAVFIHAFCAGLSGLYIWSFKNKKVRILPFVYAAVIHGLYNFFAAFENDFRYFTFAAILFAALECRIWYKTLSKSE